jgi:holliday junction DNA helicase RuvA
VIAGLEGTLVSMGANWAVINVNGISFQVNLPTSTVSALGDIGSKVKLFTHLQLKEDTIALYGFSSSRELSVFQTLTTVSGIGPRLALSLLSAMDAEQLTLAISSGNADLLTGIPGIGKKTASRIILELKDKIGIGWALAEEVQSVQRNSEVLGALTALGYSVAEASRAVTSLPDTPGLTLEEKVKMALQYFGSK